MHQKKFLSVVIPCYNEAGNIPLIIERFVKIIQDKENIEVILVNNGSTDDTREVLEKELSNASLSCFKVVCIKTNLGYGHGILSGLACAQGDVMAWTHADMQTDPADVLSAYRKYVELSDSKIFVKGRRQNRALIPAMFTLGMQWLASLVLNTQMEDIGAQPKLFSREFYQTYLQSGPADFSLDLYAQYWASKKGKIIEIPVFFKNRIHGEAKGGGSLASRIKVSHRTASYIFEMKKNIRNKINDSLTDTLEKLAG